MEIPLSICTEEETC